MENQPSFELYVPFPSVLKAQTAYVHWTTAHHWLRKKLLANRSNQWKNGGTTLAQLQDDEPTLAWLTAESEHWMVYWRTVLEAHGIRPGGISHNA